MITADARLRCQGSNPPGKLCQLIGSAGFPAVPDCPGFDLIWDESITLGTQDPQDLVGVLLVSRVHHGVRQVDPARQSRKGIRNDWIFYQRSQRARTLLSMNERIPAGDPALSISGQVWNGDNTRNQI